uniref:Tubulin beta chain n=1 Tax=Ganoderma boninense TaxID=34458 RepID=A0A5K1K0U6_9APHY
MLGSGRQRDQPLAESTIVRVPSSRENAITISKDEPEQRRGVYLMIQVGRCSCDLGQRSGVLGVSVSSLSTDALDGPLLSESPSQTRQHRLNHPIHVYSWSLAHGFASRQVEFDHPSRDGVRLRLRLTLTTIASRQELESDPQEPEAPCHRYQLGAELRELEGSEMPRPRQPLPLNPAGRTRSNSSSDPLVSLTLPERDSGQVAGPRAEPLPDSESEANEGPKEPPDGDQVPAEGLPAAGGLVGWIRRIRNYVLPRLTWG